MLAIALLIIGAAIKADAVLIPGEFRDMVEPSSWLTGFTDWLDALFSGRDQHPHSLQRSGSVDLSLLSAAIDDGDHSDGGETVSSALAANYELPTRQFVPVHLDAHDGIVSVASILDKIFPDNAMLAMPENELHKWLRTTWAAEEQYKTELLRDNSAFNHIDLVWVPNTIWEMYLIAKKQHNRSKQDLVTPTVFDNFIKHMNRHFPGFFVRMHFSEMIGERLDQVVITKTRYFIDIVKHFLGLIEATVRPNIFSSCTVRGINCGSLSEWYKKEIEAVNFCATVGDLDKCQSVTLFAIRAELYARIYNKKILFGRTKSVSNKVALNSQKRHRRMSSQRRLSLSSIPEQTREPASSVSSNKENEAEIYRSMAENDEQPVIDPDSGDKFLAFSLFQRYKNVASFRSLFCKHYSDKVNSYSASYLYASFLDVQHLESDHQDILYLPRTSERTALLDENTNDLPQLKKLVVSKSEAKALNTVYFKNFLPGGGKDLHHAGINYAIQASKILTEDIMILPPTFDAPVYHYKHQD